MELIPVIRTPREIPDSARKRFTINLEGERFTLENLQKMLDKHIERFKAQGFTIFPITFGVRTYDDGDASPTLTIHASRMETEDELQARIKRQEAYNAGQMNTHQEKLDNITKRKEIERILGGLTLEQLQALPTVAPE